MLLYCLRPTPQARVAPFGETVAYRSPKLPCDPFRHGGGSNIGKTTVNAPFPTKPLANGLAPVPPVGLIRFATCRIIAFNPTTPVEYRLSVRPFQNPLFCQRLFNP